MPSMVGEDEEDEENLVAHGRHDEEVDGDDLLDVVLQERAPRDRWGLTAANHVLRHGGLREVNADLAKFPDDAWRTVLRENSVGHMWDELIDPDRC